jgi:hypothetical protein
MHLALWIVAGVMAAAFAAGGIGKLVLPKDKIATAPGGAWVDAFSPAAVRALGAVDILAAAGLVLPAALGVAPVLVPLAAVGVVLLMAGAIITRVRYGGVGAIPADLGYLAVAVFVAWGRFGPQPL